MTPKTSKYGYLAGIGWLVYFNGKDVNMTFGDLKVGDRFIILTEIGYTYTYEKRQLTNERFNASFYWEYDKSISEPCRFFSDDMEVVKKE